MPPKVAYEIRFAQERREIALELAEESGQLPVKFEERASLTEEVETVAARAREFLGVTPEEQCRAAQRDKTFDMWRRALEAKDILVFAMSGAHAPLIREVRGFAIAADRFPVVAVNNRDKTNGRAFTLLHEFTHLLLGSSTLENSLSADRRMPPPVRVEERFCNAVAAAVLMPPDAIDQIARRRGRGPSSEWPTEELNELSWQFGVSREALLLRLVGRRHAAQRQYTHMRPLFENEYAKFDDPAPEANSTPIPPPNMVLGRYGSHFTRLVLESYRSRRLTMSTAAALLGVQAKYIPTVEHLAFRT